MTTLTLISVADLRKYFAGRKIWVRCKDARFQITKKAFNSSVRHLPKKPFFNVEVHDGSVLIEEVTQL